jgi:sugar/nucleoside kinase (ribokinase family)
MRHDVVTIGDATEDVFIRPKDLKIDRSGRSLSGRSVIFELGAKIPIEDTFFDIGGSACNSAVGFKRLGLKTSIIVCIGKDSISEKIISRLEDENVDLRNIIQKEKISANFSIVLIAGDERTIHRNLNDYSFLTPKKSLSSKWIYLGPLGKNSEDVFKRILNLTSEKDTKLAWNPGSLQIEDSARKYRAILKNTKIIFLNREEAIRFINIPVQNMPKELAKSLFNMGVEIVVITDGKNGAFCFDGKRYYHINATSKERVDATGAGDSFATGFTAKIIHSEDDEVDQALICEALKWAVFNSASVVSQIGTQGGLLKEDEIEEAISKNPRLNAEIL